VGADDAGIDGLITEHRELMTIMAALRRAIGGPGSEADASGVDGLLDQLESSLAHHTEREEAGLFNVLHHVDVPAEYMGLFEHDHGHLVDLLASARGDRGQIGSLLASLDVHMAREENDMFPAAEQLLGPSDWDAVEAAVAHLR
jgi:hemerythrin-like domain-containing protein